MKATKKSQSVSETLIAADRWRSQMVTAMEISNANATNAPYYPERIEGQEERTYVPKKVKKWDADNKLDGK